jgi:transcriptional regulator GlxA family with amidase domain
VSQPGRITAKSIARSSGVSHAPSPVVHRAQRYIWSRIDERLRLAEIASAAGCSRRHLCQVFSVETGETVFAHVERVRLLITVNEIRAGVKETAVAVAVGYRSYPHFVQAFRRAFSANPRTFRPAHEAARKIEARH